MSKPRKTSHEEQQFEAWCEEAVAAGLLSAYEHPPATWELLPAQSVPVTVQLKTKCKTVWRHLCREHKYTPDFRLQLTLAGVQALHDALGKVVLTDHYKDTRTVYVDTKGAFTVQRGQDQMFQCNRKMVYAQHGIWVRKVVPRDWFCATWCPEAYRWMKSRKVPTLTKAGEKAGTVDEFMRRAIK